MQTRNDIFLSALIIYFISPIIQSSVVSKAIIDASLTKLDVIIDSLELSTSIFRTQISQLEVFVSEQLTHNNIDI